MKDLKHIHFYSSLLEEANNELVRKAKKEGGVAVGYTCYYIPEALLNVGNAFSVRLRAPHTGFRRVGMRQNTLVISSRKEERAESQQQVHAKDYKKQSDDEPRSFTFKNSPCFSGHGCRFSTFACICFFGLHDDSN